MGKPTLDEETVERFKRRLRMNKRRLTVISIANLAGFVALYFGSVMARGVGYANENTLATALQILALEGFGLIGYVFSLVFFEIPNEIDNEKDTKILELKGKLAEPEKRKLIRDIGLEIQKIGDLFHEVRYRGLEEKQKGYWGVHDRFESFRKEFGHQANIDLSNTQIPKTVNQLDREINRGMQSFIAVWEDEKSRKGESFFAPELLGEPSENKKKLEDSEKKIDTLIKKLVKLCKEPEL